MIGIRYDKKYRFADMVELITRYPGFRVSYGQRLVSVEEMIKHIRSNGILREPVSFTASPELYSAFNEIHTKLEEEISKRNQRRVFSSRFKNID